MARRKTLLQLMDEMTPAVRAAFLDAAQNMRSDIQFADFLAALTDNNIERALRVIRFGAEYYTPLDQSLRIARDAGGQWAMEEVIAKGARKGARIIGRFDGRNPGAEKILADIAADRIRSDIDKIVDIRQILVRNMVEGVNPRKSALDIAGRVNRITGRREGGVIGLSGNQTQWVDNARRELEAGTDKTLRRFLGRKARDRRFDVTIKNAIKNKKKLSNAQINRMMGKYSDNLLKVRAEAIARTELLSTMNAAQQEGLSQLVDKGQLADDQITQTWDSSEDKDTRPTHRAANGQARKKGQAFDIGGHPMMYPGDPAGPPEERIQCRCRLAIDIDFIAGLNRGD